LGGTRTKGISKRSGARAGSVGRDHVFRKISDRGNIGRVELVEGQSSALELASEPVPDRIVRGEYAPARGSANGRQRKDWDPD
jgi:hypothetical protein